MNETASRKAMAKGTNGRHRRTTTRWLAMSVVVMLMVFVAAACSGGATTATRTPPSTTALTSINRTFLGAGTHPTVVVEAPSTWSPFKGFGVVSDCCGIGFWDVGMVPRNPCHSIGNLVDPGPTVDGLVTALEAQSMRNATAATDVTLGGYSGKYLQWSVPKHWVVTGDGDFASCDLQPDGTRPFVSWTGAGGKGERWQQMAGQVDRLWVLDVNGRRLVVDANYTPGTTQAQRDEEDQIVRSLRFVTDPATPTEKRLCSDLRNGVSRRILYKDATRVTNDMAADSHPLGKEALILTIGYEGARPGDQTITKEIARLKTDCGI